MANSRDLLISVGLDVTALKGDFGALRREVEKEAGLIGQLISKAIGAALKDSTKGVNIPAPKVAPPKVSPTGGGGGGAPKGAPAGVPSPDDEAKRRQQAEERANALLLEAEKRHAALREAISKQTTDDLIDDILRLREKKKEIVEAMSQAEDKASRESLNRQKKAIESEIGVRTAAASQRKEVIEDGAGVRAGILGKKRNVDGGGAFNFNQSIEAVTNVAGAIDQLSAPLVKLDEATAKMRAIGPEAAAMSKDLKAAALDSMREIPNEAADIMEAYNGAIAAGVKGGAKEIATFGTSAGKLATAAGSEIGTAGDVLSGVLNSYGLDASNASKISDQLWNTINAGVLSMDEMKASFANVLPTASAMNLSFDSLGGAMAALTQKNIPFAQATTKLNALLLEVQKPGATLAPVLKKAGVGAAELAKDFPGSLAKIDAALKSTGKTAVQAFSSSEASAAFNVFAKDLDGLKGSIADVGGPEGVGTVDKSFGEMADSISVRTKLMLNSVQSFVSQGLDKLGAGFLSVAGVTTQFAPMLTTFTQLKNIIPLDALKGAEGGILGIGKSIISTLIPGMGAAGTAGGSMWAAISGPILPIIAAIGLVVGVFVLLYKNSEPFRKSVDGFVEKLKAFADRLWKAVKPAIDAIGEAFALVGEAIGEVAGVYLDLVIAQFEFLIDIIGSVVSWVGDAVASLLGFDDAGKLMDAAFKGIAKVVQFVKAGVESFKRAVDFVKGGVIAFASEVGGALKELFSFDFEALFNRITTASERVRKGAAAAMNAGVVERRNDQIRNADVQKWEAYVKSVTAALDKAAGAGNEGIVKSNAAKIASFVTQTQTFLSTLPKDDIRIEAFKSIEQQLLDAVASAEKTLEGKQPEIKVTPKVTTKPKAVKDLTDELAKLISQNDDMAKALSRALLPEGFKADAQKIADDLDATLRDIGAQITKYQSDEYKGAKKVTELIAELERQKTLVRQESADAYIELLEATAAKEAEVWARAAADAEQATLALAERRLELLRKTMPAATEAIWVETIELFRRQQELALRTFVEASPEFQEAAAALFANFDAGVIPDRATLDRRLAELRQRLIANAPEGSELRLMLDEQAAALDELLGKLIDDEKAAGEERRKNAAASLEGRNRDLELALSLAEKIRAKFTNREDASRRDELKKNREALATEESDLLKSLANREITYTEFTDKLGAIDEKRREIDAELEKASAAGKIDILKVVNEALAGTFALTADEMAAQTSRAADELARGTGTLGAVLESAGAQFLATVGEAAVSGKNIAKEAGKAALSIAFDTLESLIPTLVAGIFGQTIASLGPIAGPVVSGLLTGTLYGLLALARGAAGFERGGLVRGGEQFVRINERGEEYVLRHSAVRRYGLATLEAMNRGELAVSPSGLLVAPTASLRPVALGVGVAPTTAADAAIAARVDARLDPLVERLDTVTTELAAIRRGTKDVAKNTGEMARKPAPPVRVDAERARREHARRT